MPLAPPQSEAPVRPASGKPAATAELFQVLWAALRTADTEWSPADLAVACANLQVRAYLYSTAGDARPTRGDSTMTPPRPGPAVVESVKAKRSS